MSNTIFLSNVVNSFTENTPDAFFARYLATFNQQFRWNSTAERVETYYLNNGEGQSFGAFWTVNSTWRLLALKVVGEVTVTQINSGSETGITGCYGTSIFPGWLFYSAANIDTSFGITSLQDGTMVEVLGATLAADAS